MEEIDLTFNMLAINYICILYVINPQNWVNIQNVYVDSENYMNHLI